MFSILLTHVDSACCVVKIKYPAHLHKKAVLKSFSIDSNGHDVLEEVNKSIGGAANRFKGITMYYHFENAKVWSIFHLRQTLRELQAKASNPNGLCVKICSIHSQGELYLNNALKKVNGFNKNTRSEFEVCFIGWQHMRVGFRPRGSSEDTPYVWLDLTFNEKNVYFNVNTFYPQGLAKLQIVRSKDFGVYTGETTLENICTNAESVMENFGEFHFFSRNCHRFVGKLAVALGLEEFSRQKLFLTRPLWSE